MGRETTFTALPLGNDLKWKFLKMESWYILLGLLKISQLMNKFPEFASEEAEMLWKGMKKEK